VNDVLLLVGNINRFNRLETYQWRRHMSRLILLTILIRQSILPSRNLIIMKTLTLLRQFTRT